MRQLLPGEFEFGNYVVKDYIGEGAFGTVLKAVDKREKEKEKEKKKDEEKEDKYKFELPFEREFREANEKKKAVKDKKNKKLFAIKVIQKDVLSDSALDQEVCALKKFNHPNIIRLREIIHTPKELCLVQKHSGYSLWDARIIFENNGPRIKRTLAQLVSALHYIHEKKYVHRDISPGNVLLSGEYLDKVTIIDLGMTRRFITNGKEDKLKVICGTEGYNAPEMRYNDPYNYGTYSGKDLDLWSCGAILHYMVYGGEPFHGKDDYFESSKNTEVIFTLEKPGVDYFPKYDQAKHLMSMMLAKLPHKRYTWEQVMQHSFLEDYRKFFEKQLGRLLKSEARPPLETTVDTPVDEECVNQLKKKVDLFRKFNMMLPSFQEKLREANMNDQEQRLEDVIRKKNPDIDVAYPPADASEQLELILDNDNDGDVIFKQSVPSGSAIPHPRDVFGPPRSNKILNNSTSGRALNEKNKMPNRLEYFLDDAAAPYKAQADLITPFYGPPRKRLSPKNGPPMKRLSPKYSPPISRISLTAENNALLKRKPVPQVKDEANEIPFINEKPISENAIMLSNNCTPEFAESKLLVADEALASAENKESSDHANLPWERNVLPTDPITPASLSLELSKVTVTKLSPHTGKISPRTITSKSPDKMLRSIKDVLENIGILSHMSGRQKMRCYRPQCEESSILTRIHDAVCGLLFGDQGKDIRFTIQLNRLNNVPGFYTVNIKRIQGSKTLFKALRKEILDSLNLYN